MKGTERHVSPDLASVIELALDLAYYRTLLTDEGLGRLAWWELHSAVMSLPEAEAKPALRWRLRLPIGRR